MIKVAWAPSYAHPLPETHRFPMEKYALLPQQLKHEGTLNNENFFEPTPISIGEALNIHEKGYINKLVNLQLNRQEQLKSGFPHSKELIARELLIAGGSKDAALFALENDIAFNIAGGTHHAFKDRAEGFCLLNDIAIASFHLLNEKNIKQILVVDLDVHQGNGTAKIFESDDRVFTFSMHGDHNYPLRKEVSNLDVPLPDGILGKDYLAILKNNLDLINSRINPEFIFFQSGVDILDSDKLGRLKVSLDDCKERDRMVLEFAKSKSIPIMACMGGGYSEDINIIVEAHANTYRLGVEIFG